MKQGLQLRLGQQLTMTPQLQQAIRLLQLSTLDLQAEIQDALESNMMLEIEEEAQVGDEQEKRAETENKQEQQSSPEETGSDEVMEKNDQLPDELPVDSNWEDTYDVPTVQEYSGSGGDGEDRDYLNQGSTSESLHDYLRWQLDLTRFSDQDRLIAALIVDGVDDDGFLRASLDDILSSASEEYPELEAEEVNTVLQRVQHFDPPGIAARDLGECLLLQLRYLPEDTPWLKEAVSLIRDYLDLLGGRDYTQLMRRMKLSREELQSVLGLVQSLNPRPGEQIASAEPTYIVPDVFVKKVKSRWQVELNEAVLPRLRVNNHYASLISQVNSRADSDSLKNHLQEARWFIKSLKSRHETLLKVTRCIVDKQSAFLDYGEEAMKPLVLHDIAIELGMHESTISRVTTQKYIHTPRGIFELKYFFSSHVSTDSGGECSSTAIRALIKKLIAAENTAKPLSDNKIATILSEQGIKVARRTVAKYREAMLIPPSNERKCLM